jgi:hypothetical protein
VNGRVSIATRALEKTITAIAAHRMGVLARDIRVVLSDDAGLLSVAVIGPLRVRPLRSDAQGPTLPERIESIRTGIRDDVTAIAGSSVGLVSVDVSRALITDERTTRESSTQ